MNTLQNIREEARAHDVEQDFLNHFYNIMTYAIKYDTKPDMVIGHAEHALEHVIGRERGKC